MQVNKFGFIREVYRVKTFGTTHYLFLVSKTISNRHLPKGLSKPVLMEETVK